MVKNYLCFMILVIKKLKYLNDKKKNYLKSNFLN
jgi:hypothetical protein